jgi:3-oxoacyl-[acyl-carrier protein] reductase
MMSLTGKTALITGASRGIGQAIATALGEAGAYIIGTATSEKGAEAISASLKSQGFNGEGRVLNLSDRESIDDLMKAINASDHSVDILINNAGITADNLFLRMKDAEWDSVIDTNLNSVFRLSKACIKHMLKQRWGRIINISSIVGVSGNAGQANYAAAKAGVIAFSKSLAQEIASRNITVNVVAPGFIDTDMTRCLTDAQRESILNAIPMKRIADPKEVADTVAFLADEKAAYITGQTLHVNGGMLMV